jgi:DNA polymerase
VPTIDWCPDCPYREFGPAIGTRGDPASPIVLVGEAPGADEIIKGLPFVGRAGTEVLWPALAEVGLHEQDVFVVNSVACRPFNTVRPKDRKASAKAILDCHGRLARQIGRPRAVIVALGVTAVQAVTGQRGFRVTKKEQGAELQSDWGTVVPTLHPADILRRGLDGSEYQMLITDLALARRIASSSDGAQMR